MQEYMIVKLNAEAAKEYDEIKKVVPQAYKERKFSDLIDFMAREEEDEHGNPALAGLEKELAGHVKQMLRKATADPNYLLVIDAYCEGSILKNFSIKDKVGSDQAAFETALEYSSDNEEIEYESLDIKLVGHSAGG